MAVMKTSPTLPAEDRPAPSEGQPRQIIGRLIPGGTGAEGPPAVEQAADRNGTVTPAAPEREPVALFCHEPPDSYIGGHVARAVPALAARGTPVHLFCRYPFVFAEAGVRVHVVGAPDEGDLLAQV